MIYRLPVRISKEAFYYQILPDLTNIYRNLKKGEHTAVSLVQTEIIDANALPLFICMLKLLENKSGNPVYLELSYNPSILAFLDTVGFFRELSRDNIIDYDVHYIGGFSEYKYNKENKILRYSPVEYFEDKLKIEKEEIRDKLAERIWGDLICTPIFKAETTPIDNDKLWNLTLIAVTELIVNAMIYSGSMSYTYIQSGISFTKNRKGHIISVADVGKGYYASLENKIKKGNGYTQEDRDRFYKYTQKMGIDIIKEINFLSIMEALYYSQTQTREMNLFELKHLLAISNANLRIHQKNREVVFTSAECSKCMDRDALHCVDCVWKRRNSEKPPIKAYPITMAGVHIEIEFVQEKKNV